MRYTEYHADKAVIKDKALLPDAMEKLAKVEDAEEIECKGCKYEECTKQLYPCRFCKRDKEDKFERVEMQESNKPKQYVLVSQGIEIYRTTDKEEAERMMNESNAKHYEYLQRCADEGERPADNMVYMHVEE